MQNISFTTEQWSIWTSAARGQLTGKGVSKHLQRKFVKYCDCTLAPRMVEWSVWGAVRNQCKVLFLVQHIQKVGKVLKYIICISYISIYEYHLLKVFINPVDDVTSGYASLYNDTASSGSAAAKWVGFVPWSSWRNLSSITHGLWFSAISYCVVGFYSSFGIPWKKDRYSEA